MSDSPSTDLHSAPADASDDDAASDQGLTSAQRIDALRSSIEASLTETLQDREPALMYDPIRYVLNGGGKRARPILLSLVAQAYGATEAEAMPAALAVEVFHNFTLVHDDIMDRSQTRRGREAVHVKWDEGTAILVGDLMLGLSYKLLTRAETADLRSAMEVYNRMVEELCVGQRLDTHFETSTDVRVDDYIRMIDGKTAALLSACFELGAVVGGAPDSDVLALADAGRYAGRAFQIQDDLLDLTADTEDWGKPVGGDLINGKRTFLTLRAIERAEADEKKWLARVLDGGLPEHDVAEARDRMERIGVLDDARDAVSEYTQYAFDAMAVLPAGPATDDLFTLLKRLQRRSH